MMNRASHCSSALSSKQVAIRHRWPDQPSGAWWFPVCPQCLQLLPVGRKTMTLLLGCTTFLLVMYDLFLATGTPSSMSDLSCLSQPAGDHVHHLLAVPGPHACLGSSIFRSALHQPKKMLPCCTPERK